MDLSVIIGCLDEEPTVGRVVEETFAVLKGLSLVSEVIVVDDGSQDDSAARARAAGARVVTSGGRATGFGHAQLVGAVEARGRWLVFLDADGEHDPAELPRLVEALAGQPALVLGSRTLGGYAAGARSWLHSRLGTPALTGLINRMFGTCITDCNTGFRAVPRDVFLDLELRTSGFEVASEMIVRAALLGVPILEVPIHQRPPPPGRQPHLRRWRDGWRHFQTIILHAPDRLLLWPGLFILALGALVFLPQLGGPIRLGPIAMDIHLMILGALLLFIGVEMAGSALVCATLAGATGAEVNRSRRLASRFTLRRVLPWAALLFFAGLAADAAVVVISGLNGWQGIMEPRLALAGTTGMGLGVQLVVLSFVHTVVDRSTRASLLSRALSLRSSAPRDRLGSEGLRPRPVPSEPTDSSPPAEAS